MVYFTSDLHLLHKGIVKYRPFESVEEHDQFMLDKIATLTKRDVLFILGDFMFDSPRFMYYDTLLAKMPCKIKLLLGNHDSRIFYSRIPSNIELMLPLVNYKGFWLSHCPIHPQEMRERKGNIHGHLHDEILDDPLYFNVNIDVNNYEFVSLDQIKEKFNGLRT